MIHAEPTLELLMADAAAATIAGHRQQAIEAYRSVVKRNPDHLDGQFLLGTMLAESGDFARALVHLRRATEIAPWSARTWNNLATLHRLMRDLPSALDAYIRALLAEPDMFEAGSNLRAMLNSMAQGLISNAEPLDVEARLLARAWAALGQFHHQREERDLALAAYRRAEQIAPGKVKVAFQIAALNGRPEARHEAAEVAEIFDGYAEIFESHLVDALEYRVPETMAALAAKLDGPDRHYERALDLGCGTGLSGKVLRERVAQLIGVDLSEKMLDRAKARDIYDALHCEDVFSFLDKDTQRYDLCVAADVLVYIGRVNELFTVLSDRLLPGALFLISIERTDEGPDYVVGASGRYAHSPAYIRATAEAAGFTLRCEHDVSLRKDGDAYCAGVLFAFGF